MYRLGQQEVSPAVANAQERTQAAKEALEEVTAAAEEAGNELKQLDAATKGLDHWAWLEVPRSMESYKRN